MATLIGLAMFVLGALGIALAHDARAAFGYLVAFSYASSIAVAALLLLMLGYTINASWMAAVRRLNERILQALYPLALLFVPVVLFAPQLYPWTAAPGPWLNLPLFSARAALYFVAWWVPAWLLCRGSRRAALGGDPYAALGRERALSSAMLFPGVLALTFAAFDWSMSLEPSWYSSAYGLYVLCGGGVGAVSLLIVLAWAAHLPELTPHHFHALGRVLFAFVILWAYIGYFQLFLITIADEPREVAFYLARSHGSWRSMGPALAIGHFALPVLLLAPRAGKLHAGYLASVSAWLLVMHYLDSYFLIMPVHAPESAQPGWQDLAAAACVVGACLAFCARLRGGLAQGDPLLALGLRYRSEL